MVVDLKKNFPRFKDWAGVTDNFVGVFPDLLKQAVEVKADLRGAIKTDSEGRAFVPSAVSSLSELPVPSEWLNYARQVCLGFGEQVLATCLQDPKALVTNRTPTGAKLSRAILALLRRKDAGEIFIKPPKNKPLYRQPRLPGLTSANIPGMASTTDGATKVRGFEILIQRIFSVVAAGQQKLVISTNFWDILNCATARATRSCFEPGNCHATAPISMALAPRVALAYLTPTDIHNASGRVWVVFSEDYAEYQVLRKYGVWPSNSDKRIHEYIKEALAESKEIPQKSWVTQADRKTMLSSTSGWDTRLVNAAGNVYNDSTTSYYAYNPEAGGTSIGFVPKYAEPICFKCGKTHKETSAALCTTCRTSNPVCSQCGANRALQVNTEYGIRLCSYCAPSSLRHTCETCGRKHPTEAALAACSHGTAVVCPSCGDKHEGKQGALCAECVAAESATTCTKCGEAVYLEGILYEGKRYCTACFKLTHAVDAEPEKPEEVGELSRADHLVRYLAARRIRTLPTELEKMATELLSKSGATPTPSSLSQTLRAKTAEAIPTPTTFVAAAAA